MPDPTPPPEELEPRRLILSTLLTLAGLFVVIGALGLWLREPLLALGEGFVREFGGLGVAVGFAIPDAFTVPVPNDTFLALGHAGGMSDLSLIVFGTLGSVGGGSIGWLLGRRLGRWPRVRRWLDGRGAALQRALARHGVKVVAVAAVTPLPYSLSAWAAGAVAMPYRVFAAVSLLRVVRVVMSLYLIQLGLLATG